MTESLVLSVQEAAASLGVSDKLIYRLVQRGEVPARKLGGRVVVSRAWRDAFVASIQPTGEVGS